MFYVYVYRDPRPAKNQQPVYVGKGSGRRSSHHWLHGNTGNKPFNDWLTMLRRTNLEPIIEIVSEFEDELESHLHECSLIDLYGRRDMKAGPLFNRTDGGIETTGLMWTKEYRERHAKGIRGRDMAAYRSTEFLEKMKAIGTGFWEAPEYRDRTAAAMRAAAVRPDVMDKKSSATKAGWQNKETRQARIDGIRASKTPELRAQLSASCSALWDDERRAKQSAKMKAVLATPEMKAQRSAVMTARWAKARKNKESTP